MGSCLIKLSLTSFKVILHICHASRVTRFAAHFEEKSTWKKFKRDITKINIRIYPQLVMASNETAVLFIWTKTIISCLYESTCENSHVRFVSRESQKVFWQLFLHNLSEEYEILSTNTLCIGLSGKPESYVLSWIFH